jgi:hypothetical protein
MKNSNHNIGNRTRDLPACSAVPHLSNKVKILYNFVPRGNMLLTNGKGLSPTVDKIGTSKSVPVLNEAKCRIKTYGRGEQGRLKAYLGPTQK